MTSPGERPFDPTLGSGVRALLFEPVSPFTALDLQEAITQVLQNYEPRVRVVSVDVNDDADRNRYSVQIEFQIVATLDTGEVDFYIERLR